MVTYEYECVSCGLPCLGTSCPNQNVPHFYCDKCNEEVMSEDLYEYEDKDVCKHCLLELVPKAY